MCNSPLHSLLQALPKCEHHMHLEGALSPPLLFELAAKNGISLPTNDPAFTSPETLATRYQNFASLADFLHYYYIGMSTLVTAEDFDAVAWDYFRRAAADGLAHAELFFDPQAHLCRGVAYETVVTGVAAARARARAVLGVSSELICCFLRHLPPLDALATLEIPALRDHLRDGTLAGIGLDSNELPFPPALFAPVYTAARACVQPQQGKQLPPGSPGILRATAHAGEEAPASYIASALDDLGATRIDHGVRLAEDPALLARVAQQGTLLTVCPISNVFLRGVAKVEDLPIREFLDRGVRFSINSDDPAYFGGHYILDNYCAVQRAFDLSVNEWKKVAANAIQGSWCADERKAELLERLVNVVREWEGQHPDLKA